MHNYNFDGKDISVKTPVVENISDIKREVVEQTATFIHTVNTFPDGLIMETKQWADRVELNTNREIKVLSDGTLSLRND